jgi:hypothetical protein
MATKHRKTRSRLQHQRDRRSPDSVLTSSLEAVVLEDFLLECMEGIEPEEAERLFGEATAGTSPEEAFAGFLAAAEKIVPSLKSPLDAEMWGSELLGMLRLLGFDPEEVEELVARVVVPMAEAASTPAALAILVVLASLGGTELARTAQAARQKLVSDGVAEPGWAAGLGTPTIGRCWAYGDVFGEQESVFATFRYGRSEHLLSVLVDHGLGGGVKDSYVGRQPKRLYRQLTEMASDDPVTFVEDLDVAEAATKLREALAAPSCPRAPDQVRDSTFTAALLRSRVALMSARVASAAGSAPGSRPAGRSTVASSSPTPAVPASVPGIWQLKVRLSGTRPPIWRRLEVPGDMSLGDLHRVIQDAFGWWNSHMHVFETDLGSFGEPDRELGFADERSVLLRDVAPRQGEQFMYTYDFGDNWEHVIVVEKLITKEPGARYPRCTGGRRACPPEDCGGVWGYEEVLGAVKDPGHEGHEEMTSWFEEVTEPGFDAAAFDLGEANARLARAG